MINRSLAPRLWIFVSLTRVAVVTGGTHGDGRSIVLGLATEGCHLAICGRREDALRQTAKEVAELGQRVVSVWADVTKPVEVERFVSEAIVEFGGVDFLVTNAGGSSGESLLDATREDWGTTVDLNLFHAVCATRAVVPSMGGSVVFVASISGRKPVHRRWQYALPKLPSSMLRPALHSNSLP